jgi:hypothetical protein
VQHGCRSHTCWSAQVSQRSRLVRRAGSGVVGRIKYGFGVNGLLFRCCCCCFAERLGDCSQTVGRQRTKGQQRLIKEGAASSAVDGRRANKWAVRGRAEEGRHRRSKQRPSQRAGERPCDAEFGARGRSAAKWRGVEKRSGKGGGVWLCNTVGGSQRAEMMDFTVLPASFA